MTRSDDIRGEMHRLGLNIAFNDSFDRGCLFINMAIDISMQGPDVRQHVKTGLSDIIEAYEEFMRVGLRD